MKKIINAQTLFIRKSRVLTQLVLSSSSCTGLEPMLRDIKTTSMQTDLS